jgi:hypothetical protein
VDPKLGYNRHPRQKTSVGFSLSVIPNFIAKSVGKKKTFADGFTDENYASKTKFPA